MAAIGFAGTAYAGDATPPKAMSDSEMDAVTAAGKPSDVGGGNVTACTFAGAFACDVTPGIQNEKATGRPPHDIDPGRGTGTIQH